MQIHFPMRIEGASLSQTVNEEQHIKQLIEQVLFTAQGERVNRPTFGSGINQLIFAPNSDVITSATQVLVQASLQQWLGELIRAESVEVINEDSTLRITIQYVIIRSQNRHVAHFVRDF